MVTRLPHRSPAFDSTHPSREQLAANARTAQATIADLRRRYESGEFGIDQLTALTEEPRMIIVAVGNALAEQMGVGE